MRKCDFHRIHTACTPHEFEKDDPPLADPFGSRRYMEKIWEIILILALAGMAFILRLDRKKEKETDETNSKK